MEKCNSDITLSKLMSVTNLGKIEERLNMNYKLCDRTMMDNEEDEIKE